MIACIHIDKSEETKKILSCGGWLVGCLPWVLVWRLIATRESRGATPTNVCERIIEARDPSEGVEGLFWLLYWDLLVSKV